MSDRLNAAFPLMISVVVMDPTQLASVYALLGGTSGLAIAQSAPKAEKPAEPAPTGAGPTPAAEQSVGGAEASQGATDTGELDAHGWPWSAELHASTKGKTKDGLWRMKVGVTRPDPKPGFPVESGTGTSQETPTPSATSQDAAAGASAPAATSGEEDDEFAAFRQAAAASDATDAAAAASVAPRKFSDADLGALCNQAAVKLGDPAPVKAIIAKYVPDGQVAHSRNIPEDQREAFAKEVEAAAGIEFTA